MKDYANLLIVITSQWGSDALPESFTSNTPPQVRCHLSAFAKCFALMLGSALVSISAVISSVG